MSQLKVVMREAEIQTANTSTRSVLEVKLSLFFPFCLDFELELEVGAATQ